MSNSNQPDPYQPQYHYIPSKGWMGDPNGTIFHEGCYHVFYQYNPDDLNYGNPNEKWANVPWGPWQFPIAKKNVPLGMWGMHWTKTEWAHIVSDDLVNWEDLPTAIKPTPDSYDQGGCFSGCTVINDGTPTIVYTSVTRTPAAGIRTKRAQSLATSDDGMLTWKKHPANPVLDAIPDTSGAMIAWHDPHVWKEDNTWYMALGCGFNEVGGAVLLYRSPDLLRWEYMHPMLVCTDINKWGTRWLVPDFFKLGDKHVLLTFACTPTGEVTMYTVGDYINNCLIPITQGILGTRPVPSSLATRTLLDDQGRRIAFGQLGEQRNEQAKKASGRHGALSLPWQLSLADDYTLHVKPVQEVCSTGQPDYKLTNIDLPANELIRTDLTGDQMEIKAEIDTAQADSITIKLFCSDNCEEETLIIFDRSANKITLDATNASLNKNCGAGVPYVAQLKLADNEPLKLHIFLDRSIIEVFANGRTCLYKRVFPTRPDSKAIAILTKGAQANVISIQAWNKNPIEIKR